MASNTALFSVADLWKKKCSELRDILKRHGQNTSGSKQILVARCFSLNPVVDESKTEVQTDGNNDSNESSDYDPLNQLQDVKTIGYNELNLTAKGRQWETDLRKFPPCNFHQLYEYLVVRTKKYGDDEMKGVCYKKMKSFQFFQEGHIKHYEIARGFGIVWVKAKVMASMKHELYKVIVVFRDNGDIMYGACECPAGLGIKGAGKCNHLGGVLFAISDFHNKGLSQRTERVSCTSKLNGWIVPRNLAVKPKPIEMIKVKKVQFGKSTANEKPTVNKFDPRAPMDTSVDTYALSNLYENLNEHAPNSGFFLYHDPPTSTSLINKPDFLDFMDSGNVAVNTSVVSSYSIKTSAMQAPAKPSNKTCSIKWIETNSDIDDSVPVNQNFIDLHVEKVLSSETISRDEILYIESETRGQANNDLWKRMHKFKATASNFGKITKCSKNPDGLLKSMFYSDPQSQAISYGKLHERDAVEAYRAYKHMTGSLVEVKSVGLLLSHDRPGLGASLDGLVTDPSASTKQGGLEVKCPFSKANMDIESACQDTKFFLKFNNGICTLKKTDNYYIQVQGQMYVANLDWVDFVVWFGNDTDIFVERIYFDKEKWYNEFLPKLDLFYKWAVVPELLTRRVQRKLPLLEQDQWKLLISSK